MKREKSEYPSAQLSPDAAQVTDNDGLSAASHDLPFSAPPVHDFANNSNGITSNNLPIPEIRPLEDLLFPKKDPRICRTMSTDHLSTLISLTHFTRSHARSLSGQTIVSPDTPQVSTSALFAENVSPTISSLELAGIQSNLSAGVLHEFWLGLLEQRQKERLDFLLILPFYDTRLEDSEEEHFEAIIAQKWRMVRSAKLEPVYRDAFKAIRKLKAERQRDVRNLKLELKSQGDVLQQSISASQKVQKEMDRLRKQMKITSEGYTGVPNLQNSAQIDQITALRQQLQEKDVRLESANKETENLKIHVKRLNKENRLMTRSFVENQRAFEDHYIRQGQLAACLDQEPAKTADIKRDLAYKDKLYNDLEKRAADCAGELRKVKMQRTLEKDRSEQKTGHLKAELESKSIALRKLALRKDKYRKSNEQILDTLKQRLTQDDFINALSEYYTEVLQDNAFLCASFEEQELELVHRREQVYDLTIANHDFSANLDEHHEKYSELEKEKTAAENKVTELQVELELLPQQYAEAVNAKVEELANLHNALAESQKFVAHISSIGATEIQHEMLKQKDNIIALQRDELIQTKKHNLALRHDLSRQTEITTDNARWIFWGQRKEELRQKRLVNLTNEVERLRNLVMVKDGTLDMTDVLNDIEAMGAVKAVRDDQVGDLARLAVKFLGYMHLFEHALKSLNIEVTVEGRKELISECRTGLAYHGVILTEDEQIAEEMYDDNWDAEELDKEDDDNTSDNGLEKEDNEADNSHLPASDAVPATNPTAAIGNPLANAISAGNATPSANGTLVATNNLPANNQLPTYGNMGNYKADLDVEAYKSKGKQKEQGEMKSGVDLIEKLFPKRLPAKDNSKASEQAKLGKLFDF